MQDPEILMVSAIFGVYQCNQNLQPLVMTDIAIEHGHNYRKTMRKAWENGGLPSGND